MRGLIERIKGERRLPFDHWRYRLLHWVFGINPTRAKDSKLPSFLYEHYCPLFHVTNTFVVMLPLIIFVKILIKLVKGVVGAIKYCISKLPSLPEKSVDAEQLEIDYIWHAIKHRSYYIYHADFERFWNIFSDDFTILSKEKVKEYFEIMCKKYFAAQDAAAERLALRNSRIAWLASTASFIFRYVGYGLYGAGTAGMIIAAYYVLPYVWENVWFIATNLVTAFKWIAYAAIVGSIFAFLGVLTINSKWFDEVSKLVVSILKTDVAPNNGLLKRSFRKTGRTIVAVVDGVVDFVHTIYDNNCPPITIVYGDEAKIENSILES